MRKLTIGVLVALLPLLVACRSKSVTPTLTSLAITGSAALQNRNQTTQLQATASLSDSTTQDVTTTSSWTSSNSGIISVSSTGLVTAVGNGTATITATYQGQNGTLAVVVTLKADPTVAVSWRRLCGPFRFQLTITVAEASGNAGMNITSLTETMSLFGAVKNQRTFTPAELAGFFSGSAHFNASQQKVMVYEGQYSPVADTEDSQANVQANFTDDNGNTKSVTANSVGRFDGC